MYTHDTSHTHNTHYDSYPYTDPTLHASTIRYMHIFFYESTHANLIEIEPVSDMFAGTTTTFNVVFSRCLEGNAGKCAGRKGGADSMSENAKTFSNLKSTTQSSVEKYNHAV